MRRPWTISSSVLIGIIIIPLRLAGSQSHRPQRYSLSTCFSSPLPPCFPPSLTLFLCFLQNVQDLGGDSICHIYPHSTFLLAAQQGPLRKHNGGKEMGSTGNLDPVLRVWDPEGEPGSRPWASRRRQGGRHTQGPFVPFSCAGCRHWKEHLLPKVVPSRQEKEAA